MKTAAGGAMSEFIAEAAFTPMPKVSSELDLPYSGPLTHDDEAWIARLTPEPIDRAWLTSANDLVELGGAGLGNAYWELQPESRWARDYFYADLLGFERAESPLSKQYINFMTRRKVPPPIDTFIADNRQLHNESIDTLSFGRTYMEGWDLAPETLFLKIKTIKAILGERTGTDAINRNARLLHADTARKAAHMQYLMEMGSKIGWSQKFMIAMISSQPAIAALTGDRMDVHIGLFQDKAPTDIQATIAASLMLVHPDRHLVALARDIPAYTRTYIQKSTKGMDAQECRNQAKSILSSEQVTRRLGLGKFAVAAHRQLHVIEAGRAKHKAAWAA